MARARGCSASPRSAASTVGGWAIDMMNGATPSGSGSMPRASAVIVALPAMRDLVDVRRVDAALTADLRGQLARVSHAATPQPPERRRGPSSWR